jgi:hypothetical protein
LIGRAEIERSLAGAWQLFLGKPDALRAFDTSIEGFWRSFQAIVLVAPIYLITAVVERTSLFGSAIAVGAFSEEAFWATQVLTLVLDWVTLPILLAGIAGMIGIRRQYPAYIVVRNWASVIMVAPFAVVSVLEGIGISEDVLLIPSVAALAFSLRFGYLIARRTLGVGIDIAIALVVLDFLVSLAVVQLIGRITGIEPMD